MGPKTRTIAQVLCQCSADNGGTPVRHHDAGTDRAARLRALRPRLRGAGALPGASVRTRTWGRKRYGKLLKGIVASLGLGFGAHRQDLTVEAVPSGPKHLHDARGDFAGR